MPKDKITGRRLQPGDPGFNNPLTPWGKIRNLVGWHQEPISQEISGFFLIDRRQHPYTAIFKNCEVPVQDNIRPVLLSAPQPFLYLGEAMKHKEKMHLSMADAEKISPVALCPDPGIGNPMPQVIIMDQKEAKER